VWYPDIQEKKSTIFEREQLDVPKKYSNMKYEFVIHYFIMQYYLRDEQEIKKSQK